MESRHKQYIFKNLEKLIKLTDVNVLVLAHLQSKGVIDEGEFQKLDLTTLTMYEKASKLYKLVIRKKNSYGYGVLLEALKITEQTGAVEVLEKGLDAEFNPMEKSFDSETEETSSIFKNKEVLFDLQAPCLLFDGRKKELEALHKLLNESNRRAVITHITAVSGLGGIGKTQLAAKYAQDYKGHYDNNVVWINSETQEALTSSFIKLATDKLGIATKNANAQQKDISIVVQDCYESKYFRNRKCLFVFDNVEKQKYLKMFLPPKDTSKNVFVLMTSRYQDWGKHVTKLELSILSEEEAISFVKKGLEIVEGAFEDDIKLLVRRLQYFPLAISQAISYISNQEKMGDYSISKYLEEFEVNSDHYLDCNLSDNLESNYTKTTFTSWKMTIDKIAQVPKYGQLAVKILHLVGYLSPDDIYRDTFFKLDNCTSEGVKNAIHLLISYSMVSGQENQNIISIHRLVQEVVRIELRRSGKEKEIINLALKLSEKCLCEKFVPHAIFLWKYIEGMPELACKFVNLATGVINTLADVGRYNEACQFGLNKLEKLKKSPQVNKMIILPFELSLGQVLRLAGNYEASLHHLNCVQEQCRSIEDIDHFLFYVKRTIAWVFECQGRYSEAFDLSLEICEKSKVIFGEQSLHTARSLFTTAGCARSMGKYDLSYLTYQEGFHCYDKATEKHECTFLHARHNFATIVADRGNKDEAITILEEINAKIIKNPGLKVPFSLRTNTLSNLGVYLSDTNKHVEAHKIFEELYKEQESVLGEDHEKTLTTLKNLGVSLFYMKRYEESYLACNTAYLKLKEKLGSESEWTLDAQQWCALVLSYQGQHSTAISLITIVVKTLERTMPLTSSNVLNSKDSYARILARANRCKEAVAVFEELKATYLQIFGEEHPNYLKCVRFIENIKLGGRELRIGSPNLE